MATRAGKRRNGSVAPRRRQQSHSRPALSEPKAPRQRDYAGQRPAEPAVPTMREPTGSPTESQLSGNLPPASPPEMPLGHPQPLSADPTKQKSALELVLEFLSRVIKDREQRKELSSLIRSVAMSVTLPLIAVIALVALFAGSIHITMHAATPLLGSLATSGTIAVIAVFVRRGRKRRVGKNLNGRSGDDDSRAHGNSDQGER